jgi:ATP-binding cassette subfamily F protein 3
LLLDEPTNHLDVATRERLEETLSAYSGTLVVATHDRYLINRLATKVIEVADGGIRAYPGTYADYLRAKSTPPVAPPPADALVAPASRPRASPASADQDPAARRRLAADLREAERQVTAAEDRLRAVETALSNPSQFQGDLNALSREHAALLQQVETLTTRWAELAEAAEGAA